MEAAAKNTLALKGQEVAINRVAEPAGKRPPSANGANWAVNSTHNFTNFKVERCYRCGGGNHAPAQCRFQDATCHKCGKGGHIASACRGRAKPTGSQRSRRPNVRTNWVAEDSDIDDELPIYTLRDKSQPYRTELLLNGKLVEMEVDTGAAVSLIGHNKFQELFPQLSLTKSTEILRTYT